MFPRILISLLLLGPGLAYGQALVSGMSIEEVQTERGRAESTMALGAKEILVYADGTRLEFVNDKLVKENEQLLKVEKPAVAETAGSKEPLIKAEDIVQKRQEKTIGASVRNNPDDFSNIANSYTDSKTLQSLQDELRSTDAASALDASSAPRNRLKAIGIAFLVEILATLIVLSIAFQVSGFPTIFRQLLLLSLAVAVVGALLDTLLGTSPLNPIRSGAGFVVLLLLIRQFTDVREWATAIKIALVARLSSIVIIWLAMIAVAMLFSL